MNWNDEAAKLAAAPKLYESEYSDAQLEFMRIVIGQAASILGMQLMVQRKMVSAAEGSLLIAVGTRDMANTFRDFAAANKTECDALIDDCTEAFDRHIGRGKGCGN